GRVKEGCALYDSAAMDLQEICAKMIEFARNGKKVVRLHSGDPSIYGALREQMELLDAAGIGYRMIPGVSSFAAAAAAVGKEYTLPEISQTIILARLAGRTPVPEKQALGSLAGHGASMAIFLSIGMIDNVVEELREGYSDNTPVAVVYKASWPQEMVIEGTIADIAEKVKAADLKLSALILVGPFLGDPISRSKLYDASFTHGCREGKE
ncbi:MAG: cobalt-precorrin-4/precorrin-4 C(11)-methyltransferase, partial [Firmicutes bacterium]|nr:cobalt-precorrin-4/precorrin-4 C(11)-methyltransferase [Bacillota bacterium]